EELHGAYSDENRAMASQYMMGRFVIQMRKWIRPGARRRWRGIGEQIPFFSKTDPRLTADEAGFYNPYSDRREEGYYTTAIRLGRRMIRDLREKGITSLGEWQKLTPYEREQLRKTVADLSIAIL